MFAWGWCMGIALMLVRRQGGGSLFIFLNFFCYQQWRKKLLLKFGAKILQSW